MSASRTRSTSNSISAIFLHEAQSQSSASENLPSSLYDIPQSLRPPSGIETSFTVHSYAKSTHFIGDRESVTSLSAINTAELPCHSEDGNSRPTTPYPKPSPVRIDNQIMNHARGDLIYQFLRVSRINNILQHSNNTRD